MNIPYDYITLVSDDDWKLVAIIPHQPHNDKSKTSFTASIPKSPKITSSNISINNNHQVESPHNNELHDLIFDNLISKHSHSNYLVGFGK